MQYIVLRTVVDLDADGDDTHNGPTHVDQPPLLCDTRGAAESALTEWIQAIRAVPATGIGSYHDWSVWEVVDGKCRQRSVVFKDGNPEIQSSREGTG